jgi:plastocyanin
MRGLAIVAAVVVAGFVVSGCDSKNEYASDPTAPTGPTPPPAAGVVTIDVVAIHGAQSFSPNPSSVPAGQMVVWRNVDNTTHRVVLNDLSVDTGNLPPGASSQPMTIGGTGGGYHCAIHPEMIGTVNQSTPTASDY